MQNSIPKTKKKQQKNGDNETKNFTDNTFYLRTYRSVQWEVKETMYVRETRWNFQEGQ